MIVCTSLIGTLGKLTPHLGFGFKFSLQEVGHFKLLGCQQRSGLASSLQKLLDAGTGAVERHFMIANGTIGGSSKIATVEIRLKCSARTPANFANAGSQPQTGLGDCAGCNCGKRRNPVVALLRQPAAFKILASSRALGRPGVTRRQGRREDECCWKQPRSRSRVDLTAVCASFFRKATAAGLLIPTLEWPSAIRGADQVRLRCAYPAGLAPRP